MNEANNQQERSVPESWDDVEDPWGDIPEAAHDHPLYQQGPMIVFGPRWTRPAPDSPAAGPDPERSKD